jgi:hypothetical protein
MKAFASQVLIFTELVPDIGPQYGSEAYLLGGLADSLLRLDHGFGSEATAELCAFIVWAMPLIPPDDEALAFFGVALLLFALLTPKLARQIDDTHLCNWCEWLINQEQHIRQLHDFGGRRWLRNGMTFKPERHWPEFGTRLIELPLPGRSAAAIDSVRLIGAALAGG